MTGPVSDNFRSGRAKQEPNRSDTFGAFHPGKRQIYPSVLHPRWMENQLMKTASFLYNETDGRTGETAIRGDEVLLRGGRLFRTDAGDRFTAFRNESYIETVCIVARQPQTHKFCTCSDLVSQTGTFREKNV